MSIRYFNDFDGPSVYLPEDGGSLTTHSPTYGESGNGLRLGDNNAGYHTVTFPETLTGIIFGGRFRYDDLNGNNMVFDLYDSGGTVFRLRNSTGTGPMDVRDAAETVLGTIPTPMSTWFTLEVKLTYGTSGTVDIRLDGVPVFSATGVDLSDGGTGFISWRAGGGDSADIDEQWVDRLWLIDTTDGGVDDWTGLLTCEYLDPDANGNSSDWVGSDGNSTDNYQLIDETGVDGADYVQAGTEGDTDLYGFSSASGGESILAVQVCAYTQLPEGGSRLLRPVVRRSSTDYTPVGSTSIVSDGMVVLEDLTVDPSTASAWTEAGVNAAEFGYEVRDS